VCLLLPGQNDSAADTAGPTGREGTAVFFEDSNVERLLRGLVRRCTGTAGLQEDLAQEALFCLWRLELQRPGQRRAWYLQGCRLHLQNYLRTGRSIDSTKRSRGQAFETFTAEEPVIDLLETDGAVWEEIYAHDLIEILSAQLNTAGRNVLLCLAEGMADREIARRLGISHTAVGKCRRKIALLTLACGGGPKPETITARPAPPRVDL
jgi:DNA-directed RNA polymerase specialized sigma24 family protein